MKYTILLLAAVAIPNLIASHNGKQVPSNQAKIYLGKTATICGTVVTYDCRESDRTTSLDLDTPYWRKGVAVEISEATRARIGPRLEDEYLQREICATGVVERRNGRYLVMLQDPSQIRVEKPSATQLPALLPDARDSATAASSSRQLSV